MNILKFIKSRNSTSVKDVARNNEILDGLVTNIDSARRIARVIHTKAYRTWTKSEDKALIAAFEKQLGRDTYALLKPKERYELLLRVANDVKRSPEAVVLRLRPTGRLKIKDNSKATLQAIAKQAKAQPQP